MSDGIRPKVSSWMLGNELSLAEQMGATLGIPTSFAEILRQQNQVPVFQAEAFAPHGTTIVVAKSASGVVMAGDRRATMGNVIAAKDVNKVQIVDDYTVMGVAGTAGLALALQELFRVELEHYEKIEQTSLSLPGKAQRLAHLIRGQLGLAMQGLVVLPVLAGWDAGAPKIYSFDVAGGRYEETNWCALGSGAPYAKGCLKKLYRLKMSLEDTATMLLQALVDAADEDAATAGLDTRRGIYPNVVSVTASGVELWSETRLAKLAKNICKSRDKRPDGPGAAVL